MAGFEAAGFKGLGFSGNPNITGSDGVDDLGAFEFLDDGIDFWMFGVDDEGYFWIGWWWLFMRWIMLGAY